MGLSSKFVSDRAINVDVISLTSAYASASVDPYQKISRLSQEKQCESRRAYPATTEHMPFLDPQFLAKTLNVRHEVPSGVVISRSTPALTINTSSHDLAGS